MATNRMTRLGGYKHHRPGSLVGRLHECYDTKGEKAARKLGEKIGLAPSTIHVQFSQYRNGSKRIAAGAKKTRRASAHA